MIHKFPKAIIVKFISVLLMAIFLYYGCTSKKKNNVEKQDQDQGIDLLALIAIQMPDWKEEKTVFLNDKDDMAEYLKDEAELYFSYGLRGIASKSYKNKKSLPILLSIFEFDKSESAYGMYSFDPVGRKENIGQEASYEHGLLVFWKSNLLVKILAQEDFSEVESDILEFGRAVDSKITVVGEKPELINLIPEIALVPDSLNFFYKNVCFSNIYYIPESTALFLPEQTEAVTALYALGNGEPLRLLLIKYSDNMESSVSYGKFGEMYYGDDFVLANKMNIIKTYEGRYDGLSLYENYVIIVFEAADSDICQKLLLATLAKLTPDNPATKPEDKGDK